MEFTVTSLCSCPSSHPSFIGAHRHVLHSSAPIATFVVHRRPSPRSSFIGAHRHGLRSSAPIATVFVHRRPSPRSSFIGSFGYYGSVITCVIGKVTYLGSGFQMGFTASFSFTRCSHFCVSLIMNTAVRIITLWISYWCHFVCSLLYVKASISLCMLFWIRHIQSSYGENLQSFCGVDLSNISATLYLASHFVVGILTLRKYFILVPICFILLFIVAPLCNSTLY